MPLTARTGVGWDNPGIWMPGDQASLAEEPGSTICERGLSPVGKGRYLRRGNDVTLVQRKPGEARGIEMSGVMVGADLAFRDPLNSEFLFRGEATATGLRIRPDSSVLASWPAWAGPPDRRDLVACRITLARA